METMSSGTENASMGQRRRSLRRRSACARALDAAKRAPASSVAAGVAVKPSFATAAMTSWRTASASPAAGQTSARAVARLTLTLSTSGMRPTTRSIREEQAAQCMPPMSKRRGQAPEGAEAFRISAMI